MYEISRFRVSDAMEMEFQYPSAHLFKAIGGNVAREYAKHPGFTGRYKGMIVGAGGILSPWKGYGEAWAIGTPLMAQHRKFFHASVKKHMVALAEVLQLRRLDAKVMLDFEVGKRWLEALEFHEEACFPKYGPNGETVVLYTRYF